LVRIFDNDNHYHLKSLTYKLAGHVLRAFHAHVWTDFPTCVLYEKAPICANRALSLARK
jgi:hypothetical protein